jgi:HSP20 family protein
MNLLTFNSEQDLNIYFDTDWFFLFPRTHEEQPTVQLKVNVIEKDDAFHLEAETPSMTQKDVWIDFHNDILTLKGDREQSSQSDKNDYRICEFRKQSFVRDFRINDKINWEKFFAKIGQGILKVTLPKKDRQNRKKIKIEVES